MGEALIKFDAVQKALATAWTEIPTGISEDISDSRLGNFFLHLLGYWFNVFSLFCPDDFWTHFSENTLVKNLLLHMKPSFSAQTLAEPVPHVRLKTTFSYVETAEDFFPKFFISFNQSTLTGGESWLENNHYQVPAEHTLQSTMVETIKFFLLYLVDHEKNKKLIRAQLSLTLIECENCL